MDKPFRIGFIGCGGIAQYQMKLLKTMAMSNVQMVAGADVSEAALAKVKEQFGIVRLYKDYKRMLEDEPNLDAVDICTPNSLHAPTTIAALEAGKHVMVEKPMAMNAREAQMMLAAAKKNRRQLIVGFQYRFAPQSKLIREQIAAGSFGKTVYVRCQALRRRGIPNWGVFGRKELQGGGPLIDIGVHILEMAHYMIGSPKPVSATGNCFTYLGNKPSNVSCMWPNWDYKTYNVEDLAVGMIRFDTGAMLALEASFAAHIEKDVWNVQIMGEHGGANWDPLQVYKDQDGYMMNLTPGYVGKWDHFEYKMRHFVEVCQGKRTNECPGEHGLMVQKMLDAVYASAKSGKEVAIK